MESTLVEDTNTLHQITVRSMRGGNLSLGLNDIRVDRGSYLGNPYELKKDESNRSQICTAYKYWLFANIQCWQKMKAQGIPPSRWGTIDPIALPVIIKVPLDLMAGLAIASAWKAPTVAQVENEFTRICHLATQQDINLICWCFPKECHADNLRAAIIWYHKAYLEECLKIETTIREFFN